MKTKINHPYQVPEGFFEDFRKSMEDEIVKNKHVKRKTISIKGLKWMKYAAVIVVLAGVGYSSLRIIKQSNKSIDDELQLTVEEVLPQISEDELTEFIIENIPSEELEKLNY